MGGDSETTTWEVLNHIVLKRISCKWWPLFAWCLRAERLGDCKVLNTSGWQTLELTSKWFAFAKQIT